MTTDAVIVIASRERQRTNRLVEAMARGMCSDDVPWERVPEFTREYWLSKARVALAALRVEEDLV